MKTQKELQDIIRYYGSLEVYNEEQRRCSLITIETTSSHHRLTISPGSKMNCTARLASTEIFPPKWTKLS